MVDYLVELFFDGQWNNITPDVRDSDPIVMTRGRRDWATATDPSTCSLKLNNGTSHVSTSVQGRYSPRNPRSDLYGKIGRNTPLRVRVDGTRNRYMVVPGLASSYVTTPDAAALDITGDIDVRVDIHPETWRHPGMTNSLNGGFLLAKKWETESDERSWAFFVDEDGFLSLSWSTDGTDSGVTGAVSTVAVPATSGRLALRVTLDVNNGAAGKDVKFYTAPTIDGSWTQLGATVTTAGTTSIYSSTAALEVGSQDDDEGDEVVRTAMPGIVYAAKVLNGIGGTEVANPDFTIHEPESRSFTDAAGRVWTLQSSATFVDTTVRFAGEVNSWPLEWDLSGADRWVRLTASGLTRRIQQGSKPLKSSLFRDLSARDDVVAYWPLEEARGATQFNSGFAGDTSFLTASSSGTITAAGDGDTFVASDPLLTLGTGLITGDVPFYSGATAQRLCFLLSVPADVTWASTKRIARVFTTGTIRRWDFNLLTSGWLEVRAYTAGGTELDDLTLVADSRGVPCLISLRLTQVGADVEARLQRNPIGVDPGSSASTTFPNIANRTFGRFDNVTFGSLSDMEGSTFGHAFILNDDTESFLAQDSVENSLFAWLGETTVSRVDRVLGDESLPAMHLLGAPESNSIVRGYAVDTGTARTDALERMGHQLRKTLINLLREAPTTDLGLLSDRPDAVGLRYRPRGTLYAQEPVLTLDYSAGVLAPPFRPVEDDQAIQNEVTVVRARGSSFTAEDTTGPLSTSSHPDGVGRYDISQEVSLDSDERLSEHAGWRLHLGTVDEPRFPDVTLNLRNPQLESLLDEILSVKEGDIVRITNPPEWLPAGSYDLFVEGFREETTSATHLITFNCSPGSAWQVGVWDEDDGPGEARYSSAGSTINEDLTTTETDVGVATPSGVLWGDDDAPYDIVIGGERMTVTAVTGATSPQTFTVVRSVNGVIKTHSSGAEVTLAKPARYAL